MNTTPQVASEPLIDDYQTVEINSTYLSSCYVTLLTLSSTMTTIWHLPSDWATREQGALRILQEGGLFKSGEDKVWILFSNDHFLYCQPDESSGYLFPRCSEINKGDTQLNKNNLMVILRVCTRAKRIQMREQLAGLSTLLVIIHWNPSPWKTGNLWKINMEKSVLARFEQFSVHSL